MKIMLGTQNKEKIADFGKILELYSSKTMQVLEVPAGPLDPEEGEVSLTHNSITKAAYYGRKFGVHAIGDDTGFFVEGLGKNPGVIAKRWAEATSETLWGKTLRLLAGISNRQAYIETVISLYYPETNKVTAVVNRTYGQIAYANNSHPNHFGYRGIFIPDGTRKTLAEMSEEERLLPKFNARTSGLIAILGKM